MQYQENNSNRTPEPPEDLDVRAEDYAENLSTQLRKGILSYCVLLSCQKTAYTSEILQKLRTLSMVVAEGTIYPLLARLIKDGLLSYSWRESEQGPPRKYYQITAYGRAVCQKLAVTIHVFNQSISELERSNDQ
jgi:PadR family transcriptional regulator PadR